MRVKNYKNENFLGYQLSITLLTYIFIILQIIIKVLDANDNTPKFQNVTSVSVGEDTSPGTVVFTVAARDPDAGQNGIVRYEIIAGNEQGMCTLTFTGCLFTATCNCSLLLDTLFVSCVN